MWELYVWPELERAREAEDRDEEEDGAVEEDRPRRRGRTRLPTRQEYIDTGLKLGGEAEALGRQYDEWAATEEGRRLSGGGG